jgi:hypothetical protein
MQQVARLMVTMFGMHVRDQAVIFTMIIRNLTAEDVTVVTTTRR